MTPPHGRKVNPDGQTHAPTDTRDITGTYEVAIERGPEGYTVRARNGSRRLTDTEALEVGYAVVEALGDYVPKGDA